MVSPVDGPVAREFAPEGQYAGHWGIDFAVPVGTPVRAIAPGVVSFSGSVAGRLSVTIDHGGGLRTSYSYLSDRSVSQGEVVAAGTIVGFSGVDNGIDALHLSMRVNDVYINPGFSCAALVPARGLRLVA